MKLVKKMKKERREGDSRKQTEVEVKKAGGKE